MTQSGGLKSTFFSVTLCNLQNGGGEPPSPPPTPPPRALKTNFAAEVSDKIEKDCMGN